MKSAVGHEKQRSVFKTALTHLQAETIAVQDLDIATTPENLKIMEPTTPPFGVAACFRGTGKADATNESVHDPSASTAHAKPLQIMKFVQESDEGSLLKVECHKEALKSIVDKTGDRPIVVLAIAGPMRQGKSFYLNFILRRLHGTTNETEPLHGFKWRGNNDPVTDGIWMWSEPFTLKSQLDGSPFDLLLMDTQGVFDEDTGEREWSILMGLSLLTSSTFLYNTVNNINDKDLQLLNEFLSFGEMALQDPNNGGKRKPFQNLVFLLRDWNSPSQFPYGSEGGQKFIQNKLTKKASHQKSNSLVRDQLENCFQNISCILLPHPGQDALKDDYSGSVASCGPFVKEFNDSVDDILFKGNKPPSKTINGNILKGQDIFDLFTSYTKLFNEDDFLTPESIYYAQAKACNATVVNTCVATFVSRIKTKLEKDPVLLDEDLDQIYKDERQLALTQFEKSKKMGSRRLIDDADNDICNQFKSEFARLKSSYITKRQQSILEARNNAVQQYVAVMESIVKGDTFHSNEILQETSKSAQVEAIALFCSTLQLKNANNLASEKEAISALIKSKFRDFLTRNDAKRAQAEDRMRQEVGTFGQSYLEQMQTKIDGRILPHDRMCKYHAKIALSITQDFTKKHSEYPLLNTTLQLLSDKIETAYENLQKAISAQKEEAVQNAKELLSKAVIQYRQRMIAENPKEYSQFQNLHTATKKSVYADLKNSQTAQILTEILLAEIQPLFESQIGQAHAEFSAAFHKKLARSQREMEVAKKGAKAQYKERMKRLISDQISVLADQELEKEHGALWKKAMQLMSYALEENCLPLNDTEKESAKKDLSDSLKQVFTKILHQNAQKRKTAEQEIGADIDILTKKYTGEMNSSLAENDKNGTEVNIEELHTKISSKIEEKFFQLHHNSPLYAKGTQTLIDKLYHQRDTILRERALRKKSIQEKFTNAVEGALHSYITAMEELNKDSATDEEYQNAHEENMILCIEMFQKCRDPSSSSSQIAEKYENNLIVLISESFTNSFAEFKQNKINLVEAIRGAKESAKALYTQAMDIYFKESSEPFSELQFLTQHNQEKKDARLHCHNLCQALQKTRFQNDSQDIDAVLVELGTEINLISETFGKRNKERILQIRQDLESLVIPHVEEVFNKSVLTAHISVGDLVSAEEINRCLPTVVNSLTKEILSPIKSGSYAYTLRLELLEKIVAEKMKELQQAHNDVQVATNKNNELVEEAFSHYRNKMIDVLVSSCEKDNFESAQLSVSEEALDILRKSAATAPNHFLDKLETQINDFRKEMHDKSSEFASRMSEAVEDAVRIYTQGLSTYIQSRRYVDEAEITNKHHPCRNEAIRSLTNDLQKLTLYSKAVRGIESGGLAELEKRLSQILTEIQDTNLANKKATEERMETSVKTITENYIVDMNLELQTEISPTVEQVEMCHNQIFNKSMDKFSRGNSKSPLFPKWNDILKEKLQNELLAFQHQITAAQEQTKRKGEALVHDGMTYYCESMNELIKEDEDSFEKSHRLIKKVSIDLLKKSGKISTPEQAQIFANELEAQIQVAYEGFSSQIAGDRSNIQNIITKFKEQSLRNYEEKMKTFLNEKTVQISDQKLEEEHKGEMKIAQNKFNGLYDDIETSSRFFKDQQRSDVKDLTEKIQTLFEQMKELSNEKMVESKKQLDDMIAILRKKYVQNMAGGCGGKIVLGKEFEKLHISVTTSCFDELGRTWSGLYLFEEGQERLTNEIQVEKNKLASGMKAALDKIHSDLQTAVTAAVQTYTEEMNKMISEEDLVLANAHKHHEHQAMDSLIKLRGAHNATYFDKYASDLQKEIHTAHVTLIEIHHRSKNELESSLLQARENAKKFYETEMTTFFDFIPDYIDPQALENHHKLNATAATEILKEKYEGVKRLRSHDQDKEKADFDDLASSIQISYKKFQMVNNKRLRHLHDELKELQRSIKQKYTQHLKTLAEEAANEDEFTKKNADAITVFGRELRKKLEERNAEKEFITDLLNDMKLYMQEQMPDYFKMFESRMAQNETNVRAALIEARKYYNEEMSKRVKTKSWFKPEDLARINTKVINLSITKCESVTLTPEQENQLRKAMAVVYLKYSEDNTFNSLVDNPAIGIDLGTTYSCVGVLINGEVKIIPNRDVSDATTIPSYVTFNKNHTIDVGETAKSQAFLYPQNTIFDAKRLIGRSFSDPIVQEDIKLWPFSVINDNDKPKIQVFNKQFRPEDISAKILIKLKTIAETYLGKQVKEAVVTVPAYFNDGQRQATRDAAEIAGLKVKILNEPTAAAIAYKLHRTDELKRNVLIFDLGGGTFDVAVLEIKGRDIVVKATGGDTHLGGEDFDNNIVNHIIERVKTKFSIDLTRGRDSTNSQEKSKASGKLRRLRDRCEAAKRNLSDALATVIAMDSIDGNFDLREELTRTEFEDLNMNLFTKCIHLVEQSLKDAKVEKAEIDDIVLVGGSTRIPKVQELLKEFFDNKKELNGTINADEAVARGAAIQAALLHGDQATRLRETVKLTDVTPLSLGTQVRGKLMNVIIPKHSKVPCSHTKRFTTAVDSQTAVDFIIFEGENLMVRENRKLGNFLLKNIPPAPAGRQKVECTMTIDDEGILHVRAVCVSNNVEKEITIETYNGRMTKEEIQKAQTSEPFAW